MKSEKLPTKILKPGMLPWHCYPCDSGGCGFYRTIFPSLLFTGYNYKGFQFLPSHGQFFITDINYYKSKSFVVFQRSATKQQLEFIKALKKALPNLPMIFEIDDNMIDIPKWNKAYEYYNEKTQYIKEILSTVSGITTSTVPLKNFYKKYNNNIVVNPNHLPKFLWEERQTLSPVISKPRILWAGSDNHFKVRPESPEGGDFGNTLLDFIKKTVDEYQWVFVGGLPKELHEVKDKIEWHGWKHMLEYPRFMKTLKINVGVAPLMKNVFNDGKSSIKAKEYTALGIPGVYSNSYPYKDFLFSCETEEYMIDRIQLLCKDETIRNDVLEYDYQVLKDELFWEENDNMIKYINNILSLFNCKLP